MKLRKDKLTEPITATTLYLGGGTPSLMSPKDIARIIQTVDSLFNLEYGAEITLEANPGTLTKKNLTGYLDVGVNRLSIGVQSFKDSLLARLGRIHCVKDALDAFLTAREVGFKNISIDLMHSLPDQSILDWETTLSMAIKLCPDHISVYPLEVADGTAFADSMSKGSLCLPEEEEQVSMFELTAAMLKLEGYNQYEISNFAMPQYESRHNSNYWKRLSYLGFGSGAHSLWNSDSTGVRWNNVKDIGLYSKAISNSRLPEEHIENLTLKTAVSEHFFLGLRLLNGINLAEMEELYGSESIYPHLPIIADLETEGALIREGNRLRIANSSIIVSNNIFSRFV